MAKIVSEDSEFPAGLRVLAIDPDPTVLESIKKICKPFKYRVMSADDAQSSVMKAVADGACDYWFKPLREDMLKNMWIHAVRNIKNGDRQKRENDDSEFGSSSVIGGRGVVSSPRESDEVGESNHSYQPPAKKLRVIWTLDLHRQFVKAVKQIGDEAVPKKILEVMNIPGLTRDNVASHLQKYRTYLKSTPNEAKQQNEMSRLNNNIQGTAESSVGVPVRLESLTPSHVSSNTQVTLNPAPNHVSNNTLATLNLPLSDASYNTQATLNPAPSHVFNNTFPNLHLPPILATNNLGPTPTIQFPNESHPEGVTHVGHPSNITIANNFPCGGVWPPVDIQQANVLMDILQQQQRQHTMMHRQICPMNLQPSRLMVSRKTTFVTQNINHGLLSSHIVTSPGVSQIHGANIPGSTTGAVRSFPAPESNAVVPYGSRSGDLIYQEYTSIPPESLENTSFARGSSDPNFSKGIDDNNISMEEEEESN
ncbi:hypothetical protein Fmac_003704 [Flemingia macrophylla]|uniref:Myb-like domain-containing protein n=1 Tax=Flemingia macrophylla TaxID=520843 RepID=A0ABD1N2Y7_9FABA